MRRRAQIGRPDRRRNRYPLASAEGFFNTICAFKTFERRLESTSKRTYRTAALDASVERTAEVDQTSASGGTTVVPATASLPNRGPF
jgi:hypothetical protein